MKDDDRLKIDKVRDLLYTKARQAPTPTLPQPCTANGHPATFYGVFQARNVPVAVVVWDDTRNMEEVPVHLVRLNYDEQ